MMNIITSNTEEVIHTLISILSTFKDHFYTKRKHQSGLLLVTVKTINWNLFKYNPNSKRLDRQFDEADLSSEAGVPSAVAKVASHSKPSETSESAACVAFDSSRCIKQI